MPGLTRACERDPGQTERPHRPQQRPTMINIHRVDHDASYTHGWRVTIQRQTLIY